MTILDSRTSRVLFTALLFAVGLAVIAEPWYVYHWPNLKVDFTSVGQLNVNNAPSPPRFSASRPNAGSHGNATQRTSHSRGVFQAPEFIARLIGMRAIPAFSSTQP